MTKRSSNSNGHSGTRAKTLVARNVKRADYEGVHAGNFGEVKASRIAARSRAAPSSCSGDAKVGRDVTSGAGRVTCTYDGPTKHQTVIGDGACIGSDPMPLAPRRVGRKAATGA